LPCSTNDYCASKKIDLAGVNLVGVHISGKDKTIDDFARQVPSGAIAVADFTCTESEVYSIGGNNRVSGVQYSAHGTAIVPNNKYNKGKFPDL